jgi:hypothetical protein
MTPAVLTRSHTLTGVVGLSAYNKLGTHRRVSGESHR